MKGLSILCVTRNEPHVERFLLALQTLAIDVDGQLVVCFDTREYPAYCDALDKVRLVKSAGYIESILDECIGHCDGDYILRMDDDETCTQAMVDWIKAREYEKHDHWCFPRAHLWGDKQHYVKNHPLWPDQQTRLSVKWKSGGRDIIHVGSPYGPGQFAPVYIAHHKFLLKPRSEREEIARRYESIKTGCGMGGTYLPFNLPELAFSEILTGELGKGEYCG